MTKAPIPGTVKTRLRLPPRKAARLQEALIADTVEKARAIGPTTVAGAPPENLGPIEALLPADVDLVPQAAGDLGERMLAGARALFDASEDPVIILGTDAPTLPPERIESAARALEDGTHDAAVVPSADGGYVLLGLRRPLEPLFEGVAWSTPHVYRQTLQRAKEAGIPVRTGEPWYDVDTPEDLARLGEELTKEPRLAPRTAEVVADL